MAYTAPSAAAFKARFPTFGGVDDAQVTRALNDAAENAADSRWGDANRLEAVFLYTAHVLTLDGFGTGAEAEAFAAGAGGFKSIRSGALSLDRFDAAGGADGGFGTTSYGVRYAAMVRREFGGGAIATGGS